MIWTLAAYARPSQPGAHVFSVYDRNQHGTIVPDGESAVVDADNDLAIILGVPTTIASHGRENAHEFNPSMYLLDGGLWTACKESRLLMEKRYRSKHWAQVQAENNERVWGSYSHWHSVSNRDEMPATGYLIPGSRNAIRDADDDGDCVMSGVGGASEISHPWFFTVFPSCDLFIFPISELLNRNVCPTSIIFSEILASTDRGYNGLVNIAFDFDPAWDEQVAKWSEIRGGRGVVEPAIVDFFYGFLDTLDGYWNRMVWFIDHRIKRKIPTDPQDVSEDREMPAFYGMDRKYVVVKSPDHGYDGGGWHDCFDYGSIQKGDDEIEVLGSCARFVDKLEEYIRERKDQEQWRIPPSYRDMLEGPGFGVLACEYLEDMEVVLEACSQ